MEHYSAAVWLQYIEGSVTPDQARQMENHLYRCRVCLKRYALAAESSFCEQVSPDFTDRVMAGIMSAGDFVFRKYPDFQGIPKPSAKIAGPLRESAPSQVRKAGRSRRSLGNYAVAACLTLLLTAGGIFGSLASTLPEVTDSKASLAEVAVETVSSGSETVAEKTLSVLDIIKPD